MGRLNANATRRAPARAFTLIELLVVVAIIGVLAALLLPTLAKVQMSAKTTKCAANLGSWGHGYFLYLGDHDQTLPQQDKTTLSTTGTITTSNWQEAIAPYLVGGVATSSSGLRFTMRLRYPCPTANSVLPGSSMYAASGYLDPYQNVGHAPIKFLTIPNQPNFLLLADTTSFWDFRDWNGSAGIQFARHRIGKYTGSNGQANFLFADGHMETLTIAQAVARNIQTLPPQ